MSDPFLGEIRTFGFTFAPRGWAACEGQLLPIQQHQALFSLLGTIYGGDGRTTFALPDLRGRVVVGDGQGPGLADYPTGARGGEEQVTLTTAQLPSHRHDVRALDQRGRARRPVDRFLARVTRGRAYAPTSDALMNPDMVAPTGEGQPHPNVQPYLALNVCIALEGVFPSRS